MNRMFKRRPSLRKNSGGMNMLSGGRGRKNPKITVSFNSVVDFGGPETIRVRKS